MKTAVFDIETNGLLDELTIVWVIAIQHYTTGEIVFFTDYDDFGLGKSGSLRDGVIHLIDNFDVYVAHNIMGFDYHVLERFFPDLWNLDTAPFNKCWDTLSQSRVQWFDRPYRRGITGNHGLAYYGDLLGYPKPHVADWRVWDKDKLIRVLKDVEINVRALKYLEDEGQSMGIDFTKTIRRTARTQYVQTKQELNGWTADQDFMRECVIDLDQQTTKLAGEIEPMIPLYCESPNTKCTWEDLAEAWPKYDQEVPKTIYYQRERLGVLTDYPHKTTYLPVSKLFNQDGSYSSRVADWFNICPESGKNGDPLVLGAYTRVVFSTVGLTQHEKVKDFLSKRCQWVPTEFNYKKDKAKRIVRHEVSGEDEWGIFNKGDPIRTSAKLSEDSFDSIVGGIGESIALYNTLIQRRRTIENASNEEKGWLNQLRSDGKLSAGAVAFATSTGRMVQTKLVNVPSASAVYGSQMRQSWIASPGKILVSVDMDSAQLRLLANDLGDPLFTKSVVSGNEFVEYPDDGSYLGAFYKKENGVIKVYSGTDAHTFNATAFGTLNPDLVEEARVTQDHTLIKSITDIRKKAKNSIYCYLFGGGDEKFARTLGLTQARQGKAIKDTYRNNIQGLGDLEEKLLTQYRQNKWKNGGFIEVLGDTWLWSNSEHKLLNYRLMGSEAQLQNEALCWMNHQVRRKGLQNQILQLGAFHDENTWETPMEHLDTTKYLADNMYSIASDRLGLTVKITGTASTGYNWLDIH